MPTLKSNLERVALLEPLKTKPGFLLAGPTSVDGIARRLECSPRFVWDQIRKGHLKARRLSARLVRIDPADFQAWYDGSQYK
jgi:excisionase family DNA binding protein